MRNAIPHLFHVDTQNPRFLVFEKIQENGYADTSFFFFFFFFFAKLVGVIGKSRAFPIIYMSFGTIDYFCNQNLGILFYPPYPSVILLARKNPIFKNVQTSFAGH